MSASGLVLPGVPSAGWMPGVTPAPEGYEWLGNLLGVYLPAREYLGPFEAARGRVFDRDAWVRVLLARFPAEEYLCQLAILNHAATSDELTAPFVERFLDCIALDAAETVRREIGGVAAGRVAFTAVSCGPGRGRGVRPSVRPRVSETQGGSTDDGQDLAAADTTA